MFNKLVLAYLFTMPLHQIGDFCYIYAMQNLKNRLVIKADIAYWVIALSMDLTVFLLKKDVYWLVITTGIAYIVYDFILWNGLDIKYDKFDKNFIFEAVCKGKDILISRALSKVATLFYGHMASKLNDNLYAIHCVCCGIVVNMTEITDNFSFFCLAKADRAIGNFKKQCFCFIKKYGIWVVPLEYICSLGLLVLYHGKMSYLECLPWLMLYLTVCIALVFFEGMQASLSCYGRTEYLRYGGLIGIAVKIPFVWVTYNLGFGLVGFAIASFVDYACRGVYY